MSSSSWSSSSPPQLDKDADKHAAKNKANGMENNDKAKSKDKDKDKDKEKLNPKNMDVKGKVNDKGNEKEKDKDKKEQDGVINRGAKEKLAMDIIIPWKPLLDGFNEMHYASTLSYGPLLEWRYQSRPNKRRGSVAANIAFRWPRGYSKIKLDFSLGVVNRNGNMCHRKRTQQEWNCSNLYDNFSQHKGIENCFAIGTLKTFASLNSILIQLPGEASLAEGIKFRMEVHSAEWFAASDWMIAEMYSQMMDAKAQPASYLAQTLRNVEDANLELNTRLEKMQEDQTAQEELLASYAQKIKMLESKKHALTPTSSSSLVTTTTTNSAPCINPQDEPLTKKQKLSPSWSLLSEFKTNDIPLEQLTEVHWQLSRLSKEVQDLLEHQRQCVVCLERPKTHALECGHLFCQSCLTSLKQRVCPQCQKVFEREPIKIY